MDTTAKDLAQQLQVTPGRIAAISKELFGGEQGFFTPEEVTQVSGVVAILKKRQERSVIAAAKAYREGIATEIKSNPREHAPQTAGLATSGKLSNKAIANEDYALAQMRAIRRLVGIREAENELLAFFLDVGADQLPLEVEQILEASDAKVYDAALGNFDRTGGYLPAMVGSGAMLLSAAAEENQAA